MEENKQRPITDDGSYRIAPIIDRLADEVRKTNEPKERLEKFLSFVSRVALEVDKLYWELRKRDRRIDELTEEVRKLRGPSESA